MVTSQENRREKTKIYFWQKDKYIAVVIRIFHIPAGIQLIYEQRCNQWIFMKFDQREFSEFKLCTHLQFKNTQQKYSCF